MVSKMACVFKGNGAGSVCAGRKKVERNIQTMQINTSITCSSVDDILPNPEDRSNLDASCS